MKTYFLPMCVTVFWWRDGVRDYSFELNLFNRNAPTVAIRLGVFSIIWR